MRLINADALYETLCRIWDRTDSEDFEKAVFREIENAPVVEEQKTGKWRAFKIGECDLIECTACKVARPRAEMPTRNGGKIAWKFCPECGAKMEE